MRGSTALGQLSGRSALLLRNLFETIFLSQNQTPGSRWPHPYANAGFWNGALSRSKARQGKTHDWMFEYPEIRRWRSVIVGRFTVHHSSLSPSLSPSPSSSTSFRTNLLMPWFKWMTRRSEHCSLVDTVRRTLDQRAGGAAAISDADEAVIAKRSRQLLDLVGKGGGHPAAATARPAAEATAAVDDFCDSLIKNTKLVLGDFVKVKQILDEAVVTAVYNKDYSENYRWDNMKLWLMVVACLFAMVAQFYPMPFPESRPLLGICCAAYFIASSVLQLIVTYIEKDCIMITQPVKGENADALSKDTANPVENKQRAGGEVGLRI